MRTHAPFTLLPAVAALAASLFAPATAAAQADVPAAADPAVPALAQEPLPLQAAIARALTGNPALQRERLTVLSSNANVLAAEGQFDFVLGGNAIFSRRTTPRVMQLGRQDFIGGYTNTLSLDASLGRALETGGSLSIGGLVSYVDTNVAVQGCPPICSYYRTDLNLSFNHPLLRGFGREYTTANLRRQRILRDVALLNRQTRAATVLRDVVNAYWELAYATRDLAIRRSAVELAREQLRVTQAQIDVGRLSPIEAAAVERAINDRLQEVVLAEESVVNRSLELRRLLGLEVTAPLVTFSATDEPRPNADVPDLAPVLGEALENNPQLRSLRTGLAVSALDVQTAYALVRPRLDFVGQIGSTGREPDLSDTFGNTVELKNLFWSAGLAFQAPLQNRAARGQLEAARLAQEIAQLDASTYELELRQTTAQLVTRVRNASRRVELAKATVRAAERNLEAERARFSVGRSTNNDVLLRQQELKNAQIQVVRATIDQLVADNALAAITGRVLEANGVTLKGL